MHDAMHVNVVQVHLWGIVHAVNRAMHDNTSTIRSRLVWSANTFESKQSHAALQRIQSMTKATRYITAATTRVTQLAGSH
jgi:hypothetical protein